jgi:hypothetical protein
MLDAVDAALYLKSQWNYDSVESNEKFLQLNELLRLGGSVWKVGDNGRQLVRRVDLTASEAFAQAEAPGDAASTELAEAWVRAFSRNPDASDAWDHSIKAIEAVLIPIVVPKQDKPTLGHVVSHLDRQGHLWKLLLPGPNDDYSIEPLVAMLRLVWPNPDRHGSAAKRRTPTLDEASSVVHLSVAIVQMARNGQIVRR